LNRRWRWFAAAIVLGLLLAADHRGWLLVRDAHDLPRYHGRIANVERVIDGDTIDIALPDELSDAEVTRIRLWGIDCPELAHFDQPEQPLARDAKTLAVEMVEGREVRLFLEAHQPRDSFGRVLAHVELTDGRSLNEALLEAGLARADDRWPHARLTRYAQVELAARRAKIGMWDGDRKATATAAEGQ
jgi:micrococcal nuclease